MHFVFRTIITAAALMVVAYVLPGIDVVGWFPAVVAALFLIIANAIVRPVLIVLTLPVTLATLGLFIFVINATILFYVASFVDGVYIADFWNALIGSILISIISIFTNKHS